MSISTSMYIGASGLDAQGEGINVVGDNIANASTFGYKSARADFDEVIAGTAPNGQGLGDGVRFGGPQTNFTQGAVQATGQNLDLAVTGEGFFDVKGSYNGINTDYYTRDGRFHIDNTGTVVNNDGLHLQGYMINSQGQQAVTPSDLSFPPTSPPLQSANVAMSVNLDAGSSVPPAFVPGNAVATSNYETSTTVYDSLGAAHNVQVYFHNGGGGTWDWHALVDGADVGGVKGTPTSIGTGSLTFDGAGALVTMSGSITASFTNANPGQTIAMNFGDPTGAGGTGLAGTTQFSAPNNVKSLDTDGYAAGSLASLSMNVAGDGTINATYSNGQTRPVGRVALAMFASEAGLQNVGSQLFSATFHDAAGKSSSGQALLDAAATGGRGSIAGGSLETSNVDLGTELVTLIAYQRAFSADSRTINTADQMLAQVSQLGQ